MRFLSLSVFGLMAATLITGSLAHANELDNEAKVTNEQIALSKDLPATLVVRTNAATGEVQVMHSSEKIEAASVAPAAVAQANFVKADASLIAKGGELDHDSSRSSWYFCFNNGWAYPQYYYYGYAYNYNYYYGYNWGGWNYAYYRWNYGWY